MTYECIWLSIYYSTIELYLKTTKCDKIMFKFIYNQIILYFNELFQTKNQNALNESLQWKITFCRYYWWKQNSWLLNTQLKIIQ